WVMAEQSTEQAGTKDPVPFARAWRPLSTIANAMPRAVIAAEDQKFFEHFGFDWEAVREAMAYNERKAGRRVKGASTISQQTAKNVFCWPGRTFVRKGIEAWFTLLIECLWSKERIIEVYLNVAEMGRNTFGVEAAAQRCFGRHAAQLTPSQAACIAAVLPLPRKFDCAHPSGYVSRRQAWILGQMGHLSDLMDPKVRAAQRAATDCEEQRRTRRRR
ncbi:MAG: monofunctional biosynthetic peptidoglycan transglycosylase, partial [Flavobacteriales bacterium]